MFRNFAALVACLFSFNAVAANLLVNSGFEDGLTGWSGAGAIRANDPLAYEGSQYLFGGISSSYQVSQTVDLLSAGFTEAELDSGLLEATFGGWQAGYTGQTDEGEISVVLYSDDGLGIIGSASLGAFFTNDQSWVERIGNIDVLAGTRFIEFRFDGLRRQGSNNDAYLDAAFLNVAAVPVPAAVWLFGSALVGFGWFGRRASA